MPDCRQKPTYKESRQLVDGYISSELVRYKLLSGAKRRLYYALQIGKGVKETYPKICKYSPKYR